jgi:hypothetical protein
METNTRGQTTPSSLGIEDDERYVEEADNFITRNRDALNMSIARSRDQLSRGQAAKETIDDVVEEGRARFQRR